MSATFGKFKESSYSSDYIKNKKNEEILCNNVKYCKASGGTNITNKKTLEENCEIYPFNKKNLIVNLYSKLNLHNVKTICKGTNICDSSSMKTNIDITAVPLYQYYITDPNGSLFGNNECAKNNYTKYIVPDIYDDGDGDEDGDGDGDGDE